MRWGPKVVYPSIPWPHDLAYPRREDSSLAEKRRWPSSSLPAGCLPEAEAEQNSGILSFLVTLSFAKKT